MKYHIRRIILAAFMLAFATSCARQSGSLVGAQCSLKNLSAQDVLAWAHLDDTLNYHLDQVRFGEADGKSILADYVLVLNGKEMVEFVKTHGYQSFRGPIAVRKRSTSIEVDVEIRGKDGAKSVITLFADGTMQGVG